MRGLIVYTVYLLYTRADLALSEGLRSSSCTAGVAGRDGGIVCIRLLSSV